MMHDALLEREAVSLIQENLAEAVAAHALRDGTPGARGWKVSLSTVDGSEHILRTGLTQDFAHRLAVEATNCILTLRTGRQYPEDRVPAPLAHEAPQGVTCELAAGAVSYEGTDAETGLPRPAWKPNEAARLEALRQMTLRELAANRLIPRGAWERLGALLPPAGPVRVHWRRRGLAASGQMHRTKDWHLVAGASRLTLCGKLIPTPDDFEVFDGRHMRVSTGRIPACPVCQAARGKEATR